jgi:hypothetical protein
MPKFSKVWTTFEGFGPASREIRHYIVPDRFRWRISNVPSVCPDGTRLRFTGANFSYGIGRDLDEAAIRLKHRKTEREAKEEIKRGNLQAIRMHDLQEA